MNTPRRRGPRWVQLGRNVQMPSGLEGRDALLAELGAWQAQLPPSGGFTGLTALEVYGVPLPCLPEGLPRFGAMGVVQGEVKPGRRGLVVSRHRGLRMHVVDGIRVVSPAEALLACARHLPVLDLVCLTDAVLGLPGVAAEQVWPDPRRKGAPALRHALALADGRSESWWESVLRLLHVTLGAEVTPQVEVFDDAGRFVARADLLLVGTNALHEYDGAGHRDVVQHRKDLDRDRRIVASGRVRRGYTSDVVLYRPQVVMRDCESSLGRGLDPATLSAWTRLVGDSLHTTSGRQALLRRVRPEVVAKDS